LAVRALLLSLALIAAGCGRGGDESAAPEPATTRAKTTTRSMPAEQVGYIRSVSTAGPTATLAFDDAQFLTGKEAQQAAEDDGAVEPGESVPNDYYIRDPDKATRTLRIANEATVTSVHCSPCREGVHGELGPFLASFMHPRRGYGGPYRGRYGLYWLTIEDGQVVAIREQYVP
jgi:hypothetical protein